MDSAHTSTQPKIQDDFVDVCDALTGAKIARFNVNTKEIEVKIRRDGKPFIGRAQLPLKNVSN